MTSLNAVADDIERLNRWMLLNAYRLEDERRPGALPAFLPFMIKELTEATEAVRGAAMRLHPMGSSDPQPRSLGLSRLRFRDVSSE